MHALISSNSNPHNGNMPYSTSLAYPESGPDGLVKQKSRSVEPSKPSYCVVSSILVLGILKSTTLIKAI